MNHFLISKAGCIPYNPNLKKKSRDLRKNMTKAEKRLWYDFLSKHKLRFKRQKPLDYYIADFYCTKALLVIEVDGEYHFTDKAIEHDEIRTIELEKYGIEVIRFTNNEIFSNFEGVCKAIDEKIEERLLKL